MGDYKQINKELIDANRELKQINSTYQKELVFMRAEFMEQQRLRVEAERNCRDRLLALAVHTFRSALKEIDPDVNVQELLGYTNNGSNVYSTGGGQNGSQRVSRRSTQIVEEFRRSSAVFRRRSVGQISPRRPSHNENRTKESTDTDPIGEFSDSDMDLENSTNNINVIDVENDETNEEGGGMRCINESSEGEFEEDLLTAVETRSWNPFRDISNSQPSGENSPKPNVVTKRGKHRSCRRNSRNSIEGVRNAVQDCILTPPRYSDMDIEDELASVRCSLQFTDSNIENNAQQNKDNNQTEQFCRRVVVKLRRVTKAPLPAILNDAEDHTITPEKCINLRESSQIGERTLSLGLTEFSMGNFIEAPCSTPCTVAAAPTEEKLNSRTTKCALALEDMTSNIAQKSSNSFQPEETSINSRPSRKCTPRSLAEPNLRYKLRNPTVQRKTKSKKT